MAMLCYTKFCYLLSVLAPTHIIIIKDNGCMLLITALTIKYRIHLLLNAKEVTWKIKIIKIWRKEENILSLKVFSYLYYECF